MTSDTNALLLCADLLYADLLCADLLYADLAVYGATSPSVRALMPERLAARSAVRW